MHTTRKDQKYDFSGAFKYLASKVTRIFPEKDPEYQRFKKNGNFKGGWNGKRLYMGWTIAILILPMERSIKMWTFLTSQGNPLLTNGTKFPNQSGWRYLPTQSGLQRKIRYIPYLLRWIPCKLPQKYTPSQRGWRPLMQLLKRYIMCSHIAEEQEWLAYLIMVEMLVA